MIEALILAAAVKAVPMEVRLKDGATWTVTAERTHTEQRDGASAGWSLRTERQLRWRKGGLTGNDELTITPVKAEAGPGAAPELAAAHAFPGPVTVEVDFQLKPMSFVDPKAVRAIQAGLEPESAKGPAWRTDAAAMARIAPELALVSRGQSHPLVPGKPQIYAPTLPGPVGPVKGQGAFTLESHDPQAGRAVIVWRQTVEPAAIRESVEQALAMARKIDPTRAERLAREMPAFTTGFEDTCRYEIDLPTGLAARTVCDLTAGSDTHRVSDRWVITQSLPEPR